MDTNHKAGMDCFVFQHYQVLTDTAFFGLAAEMKDQALGWVQFAMEADSGGSGSSSSALADCGVGIDDIMMRALQDSFDATTTLSVKRTGQQLIAQGLASDTIKDMISRGMDLCKQLVEPINDIESLLMLPMTQISKTRAIEALKIAAQPFDNLEKFGAELEMMVRMHRKRAGNQLRCKMHTRRVFQ